MKKLAYAGAVAVAVASDIALAGSVLGAIMPFGQSTVLILARYRKSGPRPLRFAKP